MIVTLYTASYYVISMQYQLHTFRSIQIAKSHYKGQDYNNRQKLTVSGVAKLTADDISICVRPPIITHCSPGLIHADLYTTFLFQGTTNQPDISIIAPC